MDFGGLSGIWGWRSTVIFVQWSRVRPDNYPARRWYTRVHIVCFSKNIELLAFEDIVCHILMSVVCLVFRLLEI